ncbi:MAG TPA: glutamine-hydrolyzing GMP synthase [Phycisphaerales bacterium]|nr:glutamine-hydrolyzing GMP synthase [Phycisphaerales bacterium]
MTPPFSSPAPDHDPHDEIIPVLDFGGQTTQLIARRLREVGVFSTILRPDTSADELRAMQPKGIVLSGGPASIFEEGAPDMDPALLRLGVPVLGICYGMQLASRHLGAAVTRAEHREYGQANLTIADDSDLFHAVPSPTTVWMSHSDQVAALSAAHLQPIASTPTCPFAAVRSTDPQVTFFGVQFHPEVTHTPYGTDLIRNFAYAVCKCSGTWRMTEFAETQINRIRRVVGADRVICGLSGGVDSAVVTALLKRAIGDQLTCVFVDNGLLRRHERQLVETTFKDHFNIDLRVLDASKAFLKDLVGVTDPQEKRRRIGHRFVEEFKAAAEEIKGARFLAQGTLYPDVIESGHGHSGEAANIKLHHNVGGLPEELGFELIEPLRELFKDEVRKLGEVLGVPDSILWRHPFPGPGLAVRILGEITPERLEIVRSCDEIVLEEIISADLYRSTSQVFAVLLPVQSVGVMGDGRTYENVVAVRAVETRDFMSADWARIPFDVLARMSNRIINEVRGVNRVVYDISSKPPATIEWE